ncbi:hypothetical protein BCR32DRAFT_287216 [Anaeromyces robustus]|uniref:Uncharacterized protein n=1 Tax=Anaeromyces robustus TaxID=1754192 RepID=A0A1Y1VSJ9_9FUNG|nr:hypothetical protein BCR32DRAFT_287216 [Anaeromyces robustus]|eukprot:ORX64268.1 hypothetical protein BCR32DRAFT_287216 [Anaeromyces robustus]
MFSHNHIPTNILNQLIAAADELCIHKSIDCLSKANNDNDNPLLVEIGKNNDSPIMGTIYDIFPELKKLDKEADEFFRNDLFPLIKRITNNYGVINVDNNIDDETANNILEASKEEYFDKIIKYINNDNNNKDNLFPDNTKDKSRMSAEERKALNKLSDKLKQDIFDRLETYSLNLGISSTLQNNIENQYLKEIKISAIDPKKDYNKLITEVINNPSTLKNKEINELKTMLNNINENLVIDKNIKYLEGNEINDLITKLNNNKNEPKIDENVKSKLNLLLNHKEFIKNMNIKNVHFCSFENEKKNMEFINNFFNKRYVYNAESLEYIERVVFRDTHFNNKIYIPQVDNINLGLYISGYTVEDNDNKNIDVLDHIIEVMSDDQKNINLPKQLYELHTYLRNLNQCNEKSQGQKIIRDFEYTNHWVNDILQYNLVDIYKNAYNNNVQFFTGLIDSLNKIIDSNQQNKSLKDDDIKKITNNYLEYKKFILRG